MTEHDRGVSLTERGWYPSVVTEIVPQEAAAFAEAVDADPAVGIPPGFAAVYVLAATMPQLLADDSVGIDVARMLHGEQEFSWNSHPMAGERLTARGRVIGDDMKGTMRRVTLETRVTGDGGRPICTARSLMVVR